MAEELVLSPASASANKQSPPLLHPCATPGRGIRQVTMKKK